MNESNSSLQIATDISSGSYKLIEVNFTHM